MEKVKSQKAAKGSGTLRFWTSRGVYFTLAFDLYLNLNDAVIVERMTHLDSLKGSICPPQDMKPSQKSASLQWPSLRMTGENVVRHLQRLQQLRAANGYLYMVIFHAPPPPRSSFVASLPLRR
jgi:hypothetical protein